MKKEKFPEGGVINDNADNVTAGDTPEVIIPLDKLPELMKARSNLIAEALKSIAALPQIDRMVLYNRLDDIINHDRDKASQGIDGGTHLFDEAIKSL